MKGLIVKRKGLTYSLSKCENTMDGLGLKSIVYLINGVGIGNLEHGGRLSKNWRYRLKQLYR